MRKWCETDGLEPAQVQVRDLRRYAASLLGAAAWVQLAGPRRCLAARVLSDAPANATRDRPESRGAADPPSVRTLPDSYPRAAGRAARSDLGRHAAGPPRPRDAGARLRGRAARRGARDADGRLGELRRRAGARRGQGVEDANRARRRACAAGSAGLSRAGAARAGPDGERALLLSKSGRPLSTSDCATATADLVSTGEAGWRRAPARLAALLRPRTSWTAAPTRAIRELLGRSTISTTRVYTLGEVRQVETRLRQQYPRA